jgi:hypothetical protein
MAQSQHPPENPPARSLVLLYDNKYLQHPGKLHMHWLGPFYLVYIISEAGVSKMETLQGKPLKGLINGNRLKVYYGPRGQTSFSSLSQI